MSENIIKTDEIMKKMNHPKRAQITKEARAEIIIKLAEGGTLRGIEAELGISQNTVNEIKKNNGELIEHIQAKIATKKARIEEKLIFKGLEIIEMKLDEMKNDPKLRTDAKLTELSSTIKTLFDKSQIEKGEPTAISKTTHEDIETKRLELIKTARLIEKGDIIELIESVDNSDQ